MKDLNECFANRGLLSNIKVVDAATKARVQNHFDGCQGCQEWAKKHELEWK